jgi:hypothetical protein
VRRFNERLIDHWHICAFCLIKLCGEDGHWEIWCGECFDRGRALGSSGKGSFDLASRDEIGNERLVRMSAREGRECHKKRNEKTGLRQKVHPTHLLLVDRMSHPIAIRVTRLAP